MKIEVKLYGTLRRYRPESASGAPHHPFAVTLSEGSTVATLLEVLNIPDGLLNAASVNKEAVSLEATLRAEDQISLFPPTAGG